MASRADNLNGPDMFFAFKINRNGAIARDGFIVSKKYLKMNYNEIR
jgi:hypothetical protein